MLRIHAAYGKKIVRIGRGTRGRLAVESFADRGKVSPPECPISGFFPVRRDFAIFNDTDILRVGAARPEIENDL